MPGKKEKSANTDPDRETRDNVRTILLLMDGVKKLSLSVMWKNSSRSFSKGAVKYSVSFLIRSSLG